MAGLESLRTPDEVADLRGLSVNRVLGLQDSSANGGGEVSAAETAGATNGSGDPDSTRVSASEDPTPTGESSS
jgi:hypothetical protein